MAHPLGPVEAIVSKYAKMVHYMAKRYSWAVSPSLDYEDLVSEGMAGLLQAYRQYDPARGSFAPFARRKVQWEIQSHLQQREQALHIPRRLYRLAGRILRSGIERELPEQVAAALDVRADKVTEALAYLRATIDSLDREICAEGPALQLHELIAAPADDTCSEVQDYLACVPAPERRIVQLRLSGLSRQEVGQRLQIPSSAVTLALRLAGQQYKRYQGVESMAAAGKLTKEKYIDYKQLGKTDKEIVGLHKISPKTLARHKQQWGLPSRYIPPVNVEPPSVISSVPVEVTDSKERQLVEQIDRLNQALNDQLHENRLLKDLLKHYL